MTATLTQTTAMLTACGNTSEHIRRVLARTRADSSPGGKKISIVEDVEFQCQQPAKAPPAACKLLSNIAKARLTARHLNLCFKQTASTPQLEPKESTSAASEPVSPCPQEQCVLKAEAGTPLVHELAH
eukprot:572078-Rhodomonas_salina.2